MLTLYNVLFIIASGTSLKTFWGIYKMRISFMSQITLHLVSVSLVNSQYQHQYQLCKGFARLFFPQSVLCLRLYHAILVLAGEHLIIAAPRQFVYFLTQKQTSKKAMRGWGRSTRGQSFMKGHGKRQTGGESTTEHEGGKEAHYGDSCTVLDCSRQKKKSSYLKVSNGTTSKLTILQ